MTEDVKNDVPAAAPPEAGSETAAPAAEHVRADVDVTASAAAPSKDLTQLTDDIVGALKTVYDPEIPADIYELGLIYRIDVGDQRAVTIDMTLTTPNCPSAQELPQMVENAVSSVAGVGEVKVNVVWTPPWDPSRMSDEARVVLNMW
jgi:FeS assembly SUF system protein